jgi:hypothetical protein
MATDNAYKTFKDFFKNSKYEDKNLFVSNEYNFKKDLLKCRILLYL